MNATDQTKASKGPWQHNDPKRPCVNCGHPADHHIIMQRLDPAIASPCKLCSCWQFIDSKKKR